MVLMMNPSVGLTVLTSSFMTRFTIVVFPALSRPLCRWSQFRLDDNIGLVIPSSQHQDSHLLVLKACFSQNGQHCDQRQFAVSCFGKMRLVAVTE